MLFLDDFHKFWLKISVCRSFGLAEASAMVPKLLFAEASVIASAEASAESEASVEH